PTSRRSSPLPRPVATTWVAWAASDPTLTDPVGPAVPRGGTGTVPPLGASCPTPTRPSPTGRSPPSPLGADSAAAARQLSHRRRTTRVHACHREPTCRRRGRSDPTSAAPEPDRRSDRCAVARTDRQ